MFFQLAMGLLGPVFYLQGKHVRRVTPLLPEAAGERSGTQGCGEPLSLLIAGDSAAAGVGVSQQSEALTGQLVEQLAQARTVTWQLSAHTGDTSQALINKLLTQPCQTFDAVVISIGVNDVTALTSLRTWHQNLTQLAEICRDRFQAKHIYFSSLPPMHAFPALPQPLRMWLGHRAKTLNRVVADFAAKQTDCHHVRIPYVTEPEYVASDGFHPGAPAYTVWAREVALAIQTNFTVKGTSKKSDMSLRSVKSSEARR